MTESNVLALENQVCFAITVAARATVALYRPILEPLGPYDDEVPVQDRPVARCPLCGAPMTEHDIDRSGERTQLRCPAPTAAAAE